MYRKFKSFGLMLVALGALGIMGTSAAQASSVPTLTTSTGGPAHLHFTQLTGTPTHKLTLTSHPIGAGFATTECSTVTFTSTPGEPAASGSNTFTVGGHFGECTSFGIKSTITNTGCHYLIHADTYIEPNLFLGRINTQSCTFKLVALTCEVQIEPQGPLSEVNGTNSGGAGATEMKLLLHFKIKSITYKVTKDGIGCPLSGTGTFKDGDYVGESTVTGTNPETGAPVGITLH